MKKIFLNILLVLLLNFCGFSGYAQPGIVTVIAGGGASNAEGIPATSARINGIRNGLCVDIAGNIYFSDGSTIRKVVASTGLIHTVAGNGTSGYSGDGGPATAASLNFGLEGNGVCVDALGNIYMTCGSRIRKVDATSGIITTIATSIGLGATDIVLDNNGSLFFADWDGHKINKVNLSTGVMTLYAGNGMPINAGDGGPATNASIRNPYSLTIDNHGDLYVSDWGSGVIRKIDAITGIITAFTSTAPPTSRLTIDFMNNIYLSSSWGIGKLNTTSGIVEKITCDYSSATWCSDHSGVPVANFSTNTMGICIGIDGSIYFFGYGSNKIHKISSYATGLTSPLGTFSVFSNKYCNGPAISIKTDTYTSGMKVFTSFGDGTFDTSNIISGSGGGYCIFKHVYVATGTYSIKHVMFNSSVAVDSIVYTYIYNFCRTLPVKLFFDENGNCVKDGTSEEYIGIENRVVVAANSIPIDTLSVTSGFRYDAYGTPGDVYTFSIQSSIDGLIVTCPSTGIIRDTLQSANANYPFKYFGLICSSLSTHDFGVYTNVRVGPHRAVANCLVNNIHCNSSVTTAQLTSNFSPKFTFESVSPLPVFISGSHTISNISDLIHSNSSKLISYKLKLPIGAIDYLPGDTVKSVYNASPIASDANPSNNIVIRVDTVRSSYDPNYIEVSPSGCIKQEVTELTYTVGFENTGNDTAHNIYVLDTLAYGHDISSFRIMAASAVMDVYHYKAGPYNVIKFDFPDIMLPDSSHHGLCHGMFVYKIKTRQGLVNKTIIPNRVGIYFDTNPVIMTNTASNEVGCPVVSVPIIGITASGTHNILIYPNPTTDELSIKTELGAYTSFTISNTIGQQLITENITGTYTKVNVGLLPAGVYYITFKGEGVNEMQKFVKW